MNLIIVESPTKSRTLSKFLGKDFNIRASVGHIRDLPKKDKDAVDIEGGFIPHYEINEDKREIIEELKTSAEGADDIYLATDPDREGEAIAWHIAQVLNLGNSKSKTLNSKQSAYSAEAVSAAKAGQISNLKKLNGLFFMK